MKKVAMLLVTGCAVGMLAGCGIPEEEHNMLIQQLEAQHTETVDQLNAEIAAQKDLVKNEKAKVRSNRIELDDATERIKNLQQKSAETTKDLASEKAKTASLESSLKTAQSKLAAAEERVAEAETSYSTVNAEYQELKRRFEMYRKNMSALSGGTTSAAPRTEAAPAASAPAAVPQNDSDKAASLLEQMSTL